VLGRARSRRGRRRGAVHVVLVTIAPASGSL
jgi:hypothetical protein